MTEQALQFGVNLLELGFIAGIFFRMGSFNEFKVTVTKQLGEFRGRITTVETKLEQQIKEIMQ